MNVYLCFLVCLHFSIGHNHCCGFLDFRRVSSSVELKTFVLSMCIDAPESTANSRSGFFEVGGFVPSFELADMFRRKRPTLANPILANPILDLVCSWGPKGGAQTQKKVGPRRVWPQRVWSPKFRVFFPLSPQFSFFLLSLWVSSRGFLVVFGSAGAVKCSRLEFSGCRVKAPAELQRWRRNKS